MTICFDYNGMSYKVELGVLEEEKVVEDVLSVEVLAANGEYTKVDVDREDFLEGMQDFLNEKVEEEIENRALAYAEVQADAEREEKCF